MRKNLRYKILAAVMAANSFGLYAASTAAAEVIVENNILYANGTPIVIETGEEYGGGYNTIIGIDSMESGDVSGGNVTVNNGKITGTFDQLGGIFGGVATGVVQNNQVTINNGTIETNTNNDEYGYGGIFGGVADGSANSNYVTINNGYITNNNAKYGGVFGGAASGNVKGNYVTINDGDITNDNNEYGGIFGGFATHGGVSDNTNGSDVSNNQITINGGNIKNNNSLYGGVFGGFSDITNANISNNHVIIKGGTIINDVTNSSGIVGGIFGGFADGSVESNYVTIHNGNITNGNAEYGGIFGGLASSNANNNHVTINNGDITNTNSTYGGVFGGISTTGDASGNYVTINSGSITINNKTSDVINGIIGGFSGRANAEINNNHVIINGGTITNNVTTGGIFGGLSIRGTVEYNYVTINGGTINSNVYGGFSNTSPSTPVLENNQIIINGSANISNAGLYGSNRTGSDTGNILIIDGWKGNDGNGDYTVKSLNNFESINFNNLISLAETTNFTVTESVNNVGAVNINSIGAGDYGLGAVTKVLTLGSKFNGTNITIANDISNTNKYYTSDRVNADGLFVNKFSNISVTKDENNTNTINISATVEKSALAGTFIDADGTVHKNTNSTPNDETDDITTLTISDGFTANTDVVAGIYAAGNQKANSGVVNVSGSTNWQGTVYAGYSESGSVSDNTINVAAGTNAQNMVLSGGNQNVVGNTLNVTGNGSTFNSIEKFNTINFNNVALNGSNVLSLNSATFTGTTLNVNSFAGGNNYNVGDKVTLLSTQNGIAGIAAGINLASDIVTAGVARDLTISAAQSYDSKSIDLTVNGVKQNSQVNLVAENRAVAAAFVNQDTDLIADSLDVLSRDSSYGVKTFAAVHGNKSKYDVNSDIKINGWSTIVGVGNAAEFADGDNFSWGVFYENGSGNYRTYNSFNNEFFRGDGSLVYNGGGIAARYENNNGVYTEGSLRAGMLKSDMDNALRDASGNNYGYESESAYYGAHIGVGKIIGLSESSDLDVYGKFFHTYVEGDSFNVAGDKFEFDSINSDRLRVGARVTTNKENKFSTYYGLAYEYEFNGDADMKAQGINAPTQSLQGSSYMAELGLNYQPTPDSPWSFDLNLRGYTGERQGGSFNVQATYTF